MVSLCQWEQNIPYKNVSQLNKKSTVTNISHGTTLTNTPSYTVHIEQILNEQLMFDAQTVHLVDTTFSRRYSNHCTLHLRYVTHDPPATPKTLPNPKSRMTPAATSKTLPKPLIDTHSTNYRRGRPHVWVCRSDKYISPAIVAGRRTTRTRRTWDAHNSRFLA